MIAAVRQLVPRPIRRRISAGLARRHSARLQQSLAAMAASGRVIFAGPWTGEVGFELLYWAPFLRWFVTAFDVDPARVVAISRGGTANWYAPCAGGYADAFDYVDAATLRHDHDERVRLHGEQKQRHVAAMDRTLVAQVAADRGLTEYETLHPSVMFALMDPYWWRHVDRSWVLQHARYARLLPPAAADATLPASYVAVKFYFNESFPDTPANRSFAAGVVRQLATHTAVVSLTTGMRVDDHDALDLHGLGITTLPPELEPRRNLEVQSAIVAGASRFVGTYGGFAYLAPFYGVSSTAYYSNAAGFSPRHLAMAHEALTAIGAGGLLDVRPAAVPAAGEPVPDSARLSQHRVS